MLHNPFETIDQRLSYMEKLLQRLYDRQPDTPEANAQPSDLLTIEQAAEFLHLSKATIYSKCSRNELPKPYFFREQLLEYVKARRCETAPSSPWSRVSWRIIQRVLITLISLLIDHILRTQFK